MASAWRSQASSAQSPMSQCLSLIAVIFSRSLRNASALPGHKQELQCFPASSSSKELVTLAYPVMCVPSHLGTPHCGELALATLGPLCNEQLRASLSEPPQRPSAPPHSCGPSRDEAGSCRAAASRGAGLTGCVESPRGGRWRWVRGWD